MNQKTQADLEKKATDVINARGPLAYEVAAAHKVNLSTVAHEGWFHGEVMDKLTRTVPEFRHLKVYA